MTWVDHSVRLRETIISRVLGFPGTAVLNEASASESMAGPELGAKLKRAANALKTEGVDGAGEHVDYVRLRNSEAYAAFRSEMTPRLRGLVLDTLRTHDERLAFWINLYNVLVLDATITFDVQRSITEGRLGILSFFRRAAYNVGDHRFSAHDIEHGILRANRRHWAIPGVQFGPSDARPAWRVARFDPRIHFALNCASRSCPPIGFYDADHIDDQLALATANFLAQDVQIDANKGTVHLSALFNWYARDFGGRARVIPFLLGHLPEGETRDWLNAHRADLKVAYHPYDWGLNGA